MQINRTMGRLGAQARGGLTALIYAKGLRLTSSAMAAVGEGKMVSLMEVSVRFGESSRDAFRAHHEQLAPRAQRSIAPR